MFCAKPSYFYYLFLYIPATEDHEEEDNIKRHTNRRIKRTEEELKIGEEFTKEEITEKFELLKEAFDELKGWHLQFLSHAAFMFRWDDKVRV